MAMSFNEMDKKIGETQKSIDTLNAKKVKVEADNTQLKELKDLLDKLNGAVNTKTTNLNTEKGISDRIKQLKELREAAIIGSSDYKSYDTQIKKLEARLPKHTTGIKRIVPPSNYVKGNLKLTANWRLTVLQSWKRATKNASAPFRSNTRRHWII